ncbi:hypothetical protein D6D00_08628 [Aureobasidium pullulans]|nr:hypothetical protein D6D00_08628 [Aureobasidium pullulans]
MWHSVATSRSMLRASCHPSVVPSSQISGKRYRWIARTLSHRLTRPSISSAFLYICSICRACINTVLNASSSHNINRLSLSKPNFSPMPTPLKVIIAGGGIAGLTLANALEQASIDYALLERRQEIAPQVGASIGIMSNGCRVSTAYLKLLDVGSKLMLHRSWTS